ncbi:MAG: hypothetical protein IT435_16110 [Phycisphaerales bacterium]|nr:hypothetical protein [Phycisphaerales bacterium]
MVGQFWARTDDPDVGESIQYRSVSGFVLFADPLFPQINAGATVPYQADQSMGGHKLTDLAAPSSANDAARLADVSPAKTGLFWYSLDGVDPLQITLQTDSAPATSFQEVGFVPRVLYIMLYGEVTNQSDSAVLGTLSTPTEFQLRRYEGDDGSGYPGTSGATRNLLGTFTVGSDTIYVVVEHYFDPPYGFWLSLHKTSSTGPRVNIQTRQGMAMNGMLQ